MPETTGSGCAFLDYDGDGFQDLLLLNSGVWPDSDRAAAPLRPTEPGREGGRYLPALYRNRGDGTFVDVTRAAGLAIEAYAMGLCAADYDNDGDVDLFVTCLGPNYLFRNNGDGTFTDVTDAAGVRGTPFPPGGLRWKWSSACAWLDYNGDGLLDLAVGNYVRWSPEEDLHCGRPGGPKAYCPPHNYQGLPLTLYRNLGGGRFADVTRAAGLDRYRGKTWGLVACDFDGDGRQDLAVANDTVPNFLFRNVEGRRFQERGLEAGFATGMAGEARAGMGIDVADWRNDGRFGLLIGNFSSEGLGLYAGDGKGSFQDAARTTSMHDQSLPFLTFGVCFLDYDNDGWQDAFCANGHIDDLVEATGAEQGYAQRPLLFRNLAGERFVEQGRSAGAPFAGQYVLRGAARGDFDNDGDEDLLVVGSNEAPALLWRNDGGNASSWLRFTLEGRRSNRSGVGAVVVVHAGGIVQRRLVTAGSGYLSQHDLRPHFGLGSARTAERVEIRWPSGQTDVLTNLAANREYRVREGEGVAEGPVAGKGGPSGEARAGPEPPARHDSRPTGSSASR